MALLAGCMHCFHRQCIQKAIARKPECPLCRGETSEQQIVCPVISIVPVPSGDLTKQALDIALGYYDKLIVRVNNAQMVGPSSAGANDAEKFQEAHKQREQLEACLLCLVSTIEDREEQEREKFEELLAFIKVAGIAAIVGILAFLCYLYWPLIAPLAGRLAAYVWSMIGKLRDFIVKHQPELVTAIAGLLFAWQQHSELRNNDDDDE